MARPGESIVKQSEGDRVRKLRALEDRPGYPVKSETNELGKTIDTHSMKSTRPSPFGPSRSSCLSRTSRVKETMEASTALFCLPTPRLENSASG